MKKIYVIFALFTLISLTVTSQPQLTWRFNNVEVINAGTELQFDIEVKANVVGSFHRDLQVYFDYNTGGFGSDIVAGGNISYSPLTLMNVSKYLVVNMADNTSSKFAIITEATNEMSQPGNSTYYEEITTTYQGLLRITIDVMDNTATAGIAFDELLMNGGEYYQSTSNTDPIKYTNPCLYENDLSTFLLSSLYGGLTYRNAGNTVINDCSVSLYQGVTLVDVDATGASSNDYYFSGMADGSYTIEATSNKPWSLAALANSDALFINRYVLGNIPLDDLQKRAGDVNFNNDLAGNDALIIKRRVLGNITAWPGLNLDWVFEGPFGAGYGLLEGLPVNVASGLMNQNVKGLLTGDVNGSYTPPAN